MVIHTLKLLFSTLNSHNSKLRTHLLELSTSSALHIQSSQPLLDLVVALASLCLGVTPWSVSICIATERSCYIHLEGNPAPPPKRRDFLSQTDKHFDTHLPRQVYTRKISSGIVLSCLDPCLAVRLFARLS
ncbi:hypothetical protein TMatcc_005804 [Talaromyces marneffei ATCC 18224]